MSEPLRIGTRGSPLAIAQTDEVLRRIRAVEPGALLETVVIRTHGDDGMREDLRGPLDGKRAFTKRIEDALLREQVDVAVHSLKDVPTDPIPGLRLAAVPPRANPSDVLVSAEPLSLRALPPGTRIGTSSVRRKAQLLAHSSELEIVDLRGNVDTRLRRLGDRDVDGLIVAAAGLHRMGIGSYLVEHISPEFMTPAPGQGALAVECREHDASTLALLGRIDDPPTRSAVGAERAVSARIGGGCNLPLGALATWDGGDMLLRAVVASPDGRQVIRASARGPAGSPDTLVDSVFRSLVARGGDAILREVAG